MILKIEFFGILRITPDCVGVMTKKLYRYILHGTGSLLEPRKNQNRLVKNLVLSEPAGKTRFGPVLYTKRRHKSYETFVQAYPVSTLPKSTFFLKYLKKSGFFFFFFFDYYRFFSKIFSKIFKICFS